MNGSKIKTGNVARGQRAAATPPAPPSPPDLASRVAALETQVAALQTALNAKPSMDAVNAAINANSSANSNSVETTPTYASDPPTQSEVQSAIYKLNELIGGLHRPA